MRVIAAATVALGLSFLTARADVIYVNDGSAGAGTSWADAFGDLQDALAATSAGDEIWVASGTYVPDQGTGLRTATFQLLDGVAIYGGFAGNETALSQRDPVANESILSGDLDGDDGPGFTNNGENSLHVVTGSGTGSTAVLDGVTISGGNADGPLSGGFPDNSGAGMLNVIGSPTVANCVFTANYAVYGGGGMRNVDNSSPTVTNCSFVGNVATNDGGGMGNVTDSSPTIVDCLFADNSTSGAPYPEGGGMNNNNACNPTLIRCRFEGNSSRNGGAMFNYSSSSPTLIDCTFISNTAIVSGGGISNHQSSDPEVVNCRFLGNTVSGGPGGGLFSILSAPRLLNCVFSGNSASARGGAVMCKAGTVEMINVTVTRNTSTSGDAGGVNGESQGGTPSALIITNCILVSNYSPTSTGLDERRQIRLDSTSSIVISHSLVQGWTGSLGGVGNFSGPTMFVDRDGPDTIPGTEDDDLRLISGSAAIDAGDNGALPADMFDVDGDSDTGEPFPIDLGGDPRFVDDPATGDTGSGTAPIVDIGAFEASKPDVTIDATALSVQSTSIFGVGSFPSDTPTAFSLATGVYSFSGAGNAFVFEVTAAGTVDFDPSLDGFLSGRGTTTLVVSGFPVVIDSSALSPQARSIFSVFQSVDDPFRLIPGTYGFQGAGNQFVFQVSATGTVEFDVSLDGFLSGRGTTTLVVDGFVVTIDANVLSSLPRSVFGVAQSVDDPYTLIPGTYGFTAGSENMVFQLGNDGLVAGLPAALQGFPVSGNGTNMIVIGETLVAVSGVVSSDCQGPLSGVTVDLLVGEEYYTTSTDGSGSYSLAEVSAGTGEISIVIPLGFKADVPAGAEDTIDLDQNRENVNFSLLCLSATGEARSKGYWKHQASVYAKNKGSAQESETDMTTTFPSALFNNFHENQLAAIRVDGITHVGGAPVDVDAILETLKKKGSMLDKAKQQYMALLLNMASGKVLSWQEVSVDQATASQAVQHVAALINDGNTGNDEDAKDIAETINHGDSVVAGLIPLTLPDVAYARPRVVDVPFRVSPNPGGEQVYTFSFGVPRTGPASLEIFNVAGRRIATPLSGVLETGRREITWNGRTTSGQRLGHGVYFARLTTSDGSKAVKFVHLGR